MPSAALVRESIVLTDHGWIPLSGRTFPHAIYGIDRQGKVAKGGITISQDHTPCKIAFVSTNLSFGFFSSCSSILKSDGLKGPVAEIVEGNLIAETNAETVFPFQIQLHLERCTIDSIWIEIEQSAAFSLSEQVVLRCRSTLPGPLLFDDDNDLVAIEKYGGRFFCVISKNDFYDSLLKNWPKTMRCLADIWLTNDSGEFELRSSECCFGIWLLAALREAGLSYQIACETQQHTDFLYIEKSSSSTSLIGRGKSAFYRIDKSSLVQIQWSDPSWNPIANGFVLASSR